MSDKHDKQFDPTPQRLKKAREEGNVFRSMEINSVIMLSVGVSALAIMGKPSLKLFIEEFAMLFSMGPTIELTATSVATTIMGSMKNLAFAVIPFMLLMTVTGVALSAAQSGISITTKPLQPKLERISPLKGMKRIFSSRGLFGAGKSLLKIAVVLPVAYAYIKSRLPEILELHTNPPGEIPVILITWIAILGGQILAILFVLSAADFAFEKWKYKEDLKMSFQEIKDEHKENEGDPQMRVKRRQFARQLIRPRLDHAVMKSDVVLTNPTHYAVALRYDPTEADAPRVMAKGIRKRALRIKELAFQFDVPVIENKPLARALYASVNELDEIPEDLFPAIAAVLAEIYRGRDRGVA